MSAFETQKTRPSFHHLRSRPGQLPPVRIPCDTIRTSIFCLFKISWSALVLWFRKSLQRCLWTIFFGWISKTMTSRANWHNMKRPKTWPVTISGKNKTPYTIQSTLLSFDSFYCTSQNCIFHRQWWNSFWQFSSIGCLSGPATSVQSFNTAGELLYQTNFWMFQTPLVLTPVGCLFQQGLDLISISYSVCKEVERTNDFFSWHYCLSVNVTPGLIYVVCSPSFCIVSWIAKVSKMLRKRFCYWCC